MVLELLYPELMYLIYISIVMHLHTNKINIMHIKRDYRHKTYLKFQLLKLMPAVVHF